ncbi:hypothetical protein HPB50_019152 [Hyalomma asiaticum]|uniref:Uncharacterized protein n=1 Tax=Hyalomma asiaticum TaxID=266040 RepID=A0ACB7T8B1_HYAAI|nr:hypothetical protein HPB50_019152 [Hyalomma asiaticum]
MAQRGSTGHDGGGGTGSELRKLAPPGGCSAGCVLANRLSADPNNMVLLIEAGVMVDAFGRVPLFAPLLICSRFDWNHLPEPQKNACLSMKDQKRFLNRYPQLTSKYLTHAATALSEVPICEQMEQGHRKRRCRSESRRPPYTDHSHPPSASPHPQTRASTPHERFDNTEHPRRRLPATTPPRHPVPAQPTSVNQSPSQPTTEAPGRSHRDVATWSHEGVDSPAAYVSSRPWRRQKGAVVETPVSRLFRPFQGRTVTAADNRAQTACLAVPAGTRFCECGAMIIHPSHERRALHKRSTHKAQAPSPTGSEEPWPNEAAQVMMEREAQDQGFGNWLLQVATNNLSGGSAGCVLANRLSADPSNMVPLIEAGVMVHTFGQVPLFAPLLICSRFDWNHLPEPQKNEGSVFWRKERRKELVKEQ